MCVVRVFVHCSFVCEHTVGPIFTQLIAALRLNSKITCFTNRLAKRSRQEGNGWNLFLSFIWCERKLICATFNCLRSLCLAVFGGGGGVPFAQAILLFYFIFLLLFILLVLFLLWSLISSVLLRTASHMCSRSTFITLRMIESRSRDNIKTTFRIQGYKKNPINSHFHPSLPA